MDIPVDLTQLFPSFIVRLTCHDVEKTLKDKRFAVFWAFVDEMGKLSSVAQDLKQTLTSSKKLSKSTSDVLYVLWAESETPSHSVLLGFLKCGRRQLFMYNKANVCKKYDAVCLLDFYVHHTVQRIGYGKVLFDLMLKGEQVSPSMVATDKPSDSLLNFLSKHYNLTNPVWQANSYVSFPDFFDCYDGSKTMHDKTSDLAAEYVKCIAGMTGSQNNQFRISSDPRAENGAAHVTATAESNGHDNAILHLDHPDASFAMQIHEDEHVQGSHQHPDAVFDHESSSADDPPSPSAAHSDMNSLVKERRRKAMSHHQLW